MIAVLTSIIIGSFMILYAVVEYWPDQDKNC